MQIACVILVTKAVRLKYNVIYFPYVLADVIRKLPHRVNFELIPLVSGDIAAPSLALFKYLMPKIDDSCNTES